MITFIPIGGLCNRMRAMASGVYMAKRVGAEIVFFWKKYKDCFADFTDLFQSVSIEGINVLPYGKRDYYLAMSRRKNFFMPGIFRKFIFDTQITGNHEHEDEEIFSEITGKKIYIMSGYSFTKHFPVDKIFIPATDVQTKIDKLKGSFKGDVIGIHIRRGDNFHSIGKNRIEDYFGLIETEIESNPETKFYLATDSLEVKREMLMRYGERILHNEAVLERTSVQGMKDAVTDLWCLGSTKKIIGSYYSSFSDIAAEMGKIELRII